MSIREPVPTKLLGSLPESCRLNSSGTPFNRRGRSVAEAVCATPLLAAPLHRSSRAMPSPAPVQIYARTLRGRITMPMAVASVSTLFLFSF